MAQRAASVAILGQLKRMAQKEFERAPEDRLFAVLTKTMETAQFAISPATSPLAVRRALRSLDSERALSMEDEGPNRDSIRVAAYDLIKSLHVTLDRLTEQHGDGTAREAATVVVFDARSRVHEAYSQSKDGILFLVYNTLECMAECLSPMPNIDDLRKRLLMLDNQRKLEIQQEGEGAAPLRLVMLALVQATCITMVHLGCGGEQPSLLSIVKREKPVECVKLEDEENKENLAEESAERDDSSRDPVDDLSRDPVDDLFVRPPSDEEVPSGGDAGESAADAPPGFIFPQGDAEPAIDGLGEVKEEEFDMQPANYCMRDDEAVKKEEPLDDFAMLGEYSIVNPMEAREEPIEEPLHDFVTFSTTHGNLGDSTETADASAEGEAEYPDDEVELAEEEQALDQQLFGEEEEEANAEAEDSSARVAVGGGGVERRRASRLVARSAQSTQQVVGPAAKQKKRSRGKQGKRVEKTSDTEMECPECEYRHRKIRPLVLHLRQRHSTTPTLAGIVFRCECGHESFSHRHSFVCKVANFTVIRKSDGPIRRLNDKKTTPQCIVCEKHPSTVTAYARHLKEHHKSTLKESGIYLICGCGDKQYEMKRGPSHNKKCDGREFTLHKVGSVAKARRGRNH